MPLFLAPRNGLLLLAENRGRLLYLWRLPVVNKRRGGRIAGVIRGLEGGIRSGGRLGVILATWG